MQKTVIALLSAALPLLGAAADVQLIPAGEFEGVDGRPGDGLTWKLPNAAGRALVVKLNARHAKTAFQLDYEHQLLLSEQNGKPAPASAWINKFEWRDDDGLYGKSVRWTSNARAFINADEYRYISPVIAYDKTTGEVVDLLNAALVGRPNILGMNPVTQEVARLNAFFNQEQNTMSELLKALLKQLGLAESATQEQAVAALSAIQAKANNADTLGTEVAALKTKVTQAETEVAALKAKPAGTSGSGEPDPTKWVGMDKFNALNAEVVALKAGQTGAEVEALLTQAQAEGKCAGVVVDVWRDLGKKDVAALKALVEKTPANPALAGKSQTNGGGNQQQQKSGELDATALAVCSSLGLTPEQFKAGAVVAAA